MSAGRNKNNKKIIKINTEHLHVWCSSCDNELRPCKIEELNPFGDILCDNNHIVATLYEGDIKLD